MPPDADFSLNVGKRAHDYFPALNQRVHGHTLRYLDSAASALKPQQVIDAVSLYYSSYSANVHRGIHTLSEQASLAYDAARATVAKFINAPSSDTVIFTSGTTDSLNGVAQMIGHSLRPNEEIAVTEIEHHSNSVPWFMIAKQKGAVVTTIPVSQEGLVTTEEVERVLTSRTRVLAITMKSNALGVRPNLTEIITLAHQKGIIVIVDAAQSIVHEPIDVQALNCDFLAFSGHKLYGPTGIGVLYGKIELLSELEPWKGGGGMIREVTTQGFSTASVPQRFEAGTPPIAEAIGLAEAIRFVQAIGYPAIMQHEQELTARTLELLGSMPDVTIYGPRDAALQTGIISFNVRDIHAHDVAAILDQSGIALRAGHHCAQPLMQRLGIAGTARASFALYNTLEDAEALAVGIETVLDTFS